MILIVSADAGPAQGGECAVLLSRITELRRKRNRPSGICEQGKLVYMDETHLSATRAQPISVSLEDGLTGIESGSWPGPFGPLGAHDIGRIDPCPTTGR
jgi:hypothetical protein